MTAPRIRSIDATRDVEAIGAAGAGAAKGVLIAASNIHADRNARNLVSLDVHLIQRRAQAPPQLEDITLSPKTHEQQSRTLSQHVAVQRGHRDPVGAKRAQNGIHFAGDQLLALPCAPSTCAI